MWINKVVFEWHVWIWPATFLIVNTYKSIFLPGMATCLALGQWNLHWECSRTTDHSPWSHCLQTASKCWIPEETYCKNQTCVDHVIFRWQKTNTTPGFIKHNTRTPDIRLPMIRTRVVFLRSEFWNHTTLHKKVKDILKFSRCFVQFHELALVLVFKSRYW